MADQLELPRDPYDALLLENDIVGVRLWGPPTQPTLSLGRADIWDRRWFAERQPLITLARVRELAMADRLPEIAPSPNNTAYELYGRYDFPVTKPGAQLILGTPFAQTAHVEPGADGAVVLTVEGQGKRMEVSIWVCLARSLVVLRCQSTGLDARDVWLRVCRHRDTILPGEPLDPTIGGHPSATDFEQLPMPRAFRAADGWGIVQDFGADPTFPQGFSVAIGADVLGADMTVECREGEGGLGTALWAPVEGRLDHGTVKRYTPINNALGAAATARFHELPTEWTILAALATTHDGPDPVAALRQILSSGGALGAAGLEAEQRELAEHHRRLHPARIRVSEGMPTAHMARTVSQRDQQCPDCTLVSVTPMSLPNLRRPDGYYGDVPLCSVGSTKFCFQDAGLWHNDFHFNEIRAEPMLTLGLFPDLMPYCDLIHNLLPMAVENAADVYGLPGAMYPLVHFPLRCARGIAHTNLTWEQDLGINGLVTKPLWLYYLYTGDREFLKNLAYPVLSAGARFCRAYLTEESDGLLHYMPTVSPEHWGLTPRFERNRDCLSALTLTRYLLRAAAAGARALDMDEQEATAWISAAERLAPFPTYDTPDGPVWVDVAGAPPIEYNIPVPLSAVFWGDEVGMDSSPEVLEIARRTLAQIRVWKPHSPYLNYCIRNRLGLWTEGMHLTPEHLLLSYQSIHLFPCVPPTGEIAFENLAAQGGFRVSATRTAKGCIQGVQIASALGETCHLANPWPGKAVEVLKDGGACIACASPQATHIRFATRRGGIYTVRALDE